MSTGDVLTQVVSMKFGTYDQDNDNWGYGYSCGEKYESGWWYDRCSDSDLNGKYYHGPEKIPLTLWAKGIAWESWKGNRYSLKGAEMKLRPY